MKRCKTSAVEVEVSIWAEYKRHTVNVIQRLLRLFLLYPSRFCSHCLTFTKWFAMRFDKRFTLRFAVAHKTFWCFRSCLRSEGSRLCFCVVHKRFVVLHFNTLTRYEGSRLCFCVVHKRFVVLHFNTLTRYEAYPARWNTRSAYLRRRHHSILYRSVLL